MKWQNRRVRSEKKVHEKDKSLSKVNRRQFICANRN